MVKIGENKGNCFYLCLYFRTVVLAITLLLRKLTHMSTFAKD